MDWRTIVAGDINWPVVVPKDRSRSLIWRKCGRPYNGVVTQGQSEWAEMTLGEICDLGVHEWRRQEGWGDKTVELFKSVLRRIAKDPESYVGQAKATDAFNPETD